MKRKINDSDLKLFATLMAEICIVALCVAITTFLFMGLICAFCVITGAL